MKLLVCQLVFYFLHIDAAAPGFPDRDGTGRRYRSPVKVGGASVISPVMAGTVPAPEYTRNSLREQFKELHCHQVTVGRR